MKNIKLISLSVVATCVLFATEMAVTKMPNSSGTDTVSMHTASQDSNKTNTPKPYYFGEIVSIKHGGAYTYLEIKEKTDKTFWIAIETVDAKVGDFVRFNIELATKNFKSKALDKVFEDLVFASNLEYRSSKGKEDTNTSK